MDDQQQPAQTLLGSFLSNYSRSRRLEDRIRRLSAQAVVTSDSAELYTILEQLAAALQSHVERLRKLATMPSVPPERRQL
jgi:hypothetical protein